MYSHLFYAITAEIDDLKIAEIAKFDPDCNSEIEKWNVDMTFKRALQWHWFKSDVCVGPTLYGVKQVISKEQEMANLKNGLLCIGCGPNGDDLLVDAETLAVYFWNHETAKNYDALVKSDCNKLYDNVISLLLHVRNCNYIPWDAFQSQDYYALHNGL